MLWRKTQTWVGDRLGVTSDSGGVDEMLLVVVDISSVSSSTVAPTKSGIEEMEKKVEDLKDKIAEEMGIPPWSVVAIVIGK